MKRRAPPSPLDLAISSLTNFTPSGAVRGVTPGYKSSANPHAKTNANVNTNAHVGSNTSSKVTNPTTVTTSKPSSNAYATSNTSFKTTSPDTVTNAHVTSKSNASSNLNPNTNTQPNRPAPGIESERPHHETYSLKMARFWAAKAQALKEPFIPAGDDIGEGIAAGEVQYSRSTVGEMAGGWAGIDWVCSLFLFCFWLLICWCGCGGFVCLACILF
ncbi:hypothetical protein BJX68DRAFT_122664 [Aspergillus pseudodeflectus]|uniref:Uncharacterized protein n=1 Tax=Aspergillus pseudodeflectus TaxID=176178 RepID=A0ABR4K6C3_9EURO